MESTTSKMKNNSWSETMCDVVTSLYLTWACYIYTYKVFVFDWKMMNHLGSCQPPVFFNDFVIS